MIVGLGNPGTDYQWTRHNVGFLVVDRLAEMNRVPICHKRFKTIYGQGSINSHQVVLAKPMTFMNLSGRAVKKALTFFCIALEDLIVVHDDMDLPFGRLRVKRKGSDGGHQGVRSIIESLAGDTFLRLKIGIGRPPGGMEPAEYVLKPFDEFQQPHLDHVLSRVAEALTVMVREGVETTMNRYQTKLTLPSQSP